MSINISFETSQNGVYYVEEDIRLLNLEELSSNRIKSIKEINRIIKNLGPSLINGNWLNNIETIHLYQKTIKKSFEELFYRKEQGNNAINLYSNKGVIFKGAIAAFFTIALTNLLFMDKIYYNPYTSIYSGLTGVICIFPIFYYKYADAPVLKRELQQLSQLEIHKVMTAKFKTLIHRLRKLVLVATENSYITQTESLKNKIIKLNITYNNFLPAVEVWQRAFDKLEIQLKEKDSWNSIEVPEEFESDEEVSQTTESL